MSGGAIQALQLFAALSILILLHEFGHFFFARVFKTRVEKFYLFFDFLFPFPNILNFSLFKKKKGDTEYGLGWFPLGGYVKIAGMVDESMDKEAMKEEPKPWEYRSKKAYQRLFIMLGGIIMNLITAMAIYAFIFGAWGEEYLPTENAKYGIAVDSVAESIGLRDGDMITGVGGKPVDRFNKIVGEMIFDEAKSIQVTRDGVPMEIAIPEGTIHSIIKRERNTFISQRIPLIVDNVSAKSEAEKMGLKAGDSVIAVNGTPIHFFDEFEDFKKENVGKPIAITVVRDNAITTLSGNVPKSKILGFQPVGDLSRFFETKTIKYGFFEAIGKGFSYTFAQVGNYGRQLKLLFTSKEIKASESLGGLVSFGKLFSPVFDWQDFLMLTALVSIILAVMNLLPIPGLDGGYVIFLLFEMLSGRQVSDKVMERATTVGLVLLLGLMLYANGLDIFRLFQK
ncbi:MAG: RIP metalloprotease RseP [Chitinophagaceae bacterium]|nr:RIP metalloprotease RseP [Chitinophagaceae bacterium]MCB9045365.1 RIP metalloprotease RseP [Chitinophagales bacterium]